MEVMGIDLIINPEKVTADEIAKLVNVPEALSVQYYADGKVQLLELKITEKSPVVGDKIFVLAKTKEMVEIERVLGLRRSKVANVVILGGRIGYYLAEHLEKKKIGIKIIVKDIDKCKIIAQRLKHALVLNGDGTDLQLLEDENVCEIDLFVAVTGDDKLNLLVSLLAKHLGAKKTIAQIRRSDYISLVEKVGVDRAISPRMLAAEAILRFIRKGGIISVTLFNEDKAQMLELIVSVCHCH